MREIRIDQVTSRDALCVLPDTNIPNATEQLLCANVDHAPVIDRAGRPVGVLSLSDLLAAWRDFVAPVDADGRAQALRGAYSAARDVEETPGRVTTVSDVMMPYVIAVKTSDPLSLAINLMAYEGISQLLVVDPSKNYVGVVTAQNILNWVARLSGAHATQSTKAVEPESRESVAI